MTYTQNCMTPIPSPSKKHGQNWNDQPAVRGYAVVSTVNRWFTILNSQLRSDGTIHQHHHNYVATHSFLRPAKTSAMLTARNPSWRRLSSQVCTLFSQVCTRASFKFVVASINNNWWHRIQNLLLWRNYMDQYCYCPNFHIDHKIRFQSDSLGS